MVRTKPFLMGPFLLVATLFAQTPPPPTTVYVFRTLTSDGGPENSVDAARKALMEQVKLALPNNKVIANQIALADTKESATVTLEVTQASEQAQMLPTGNRIEIYVAPSYHASATLRFGTYATEFNTVQTDRPYKKIINSGRFNTPPSLDDSEMDLLRIKAAQDLARQVREWVTANAAELRKQE